tara:strand:- start:192 stop:971 length:780 start_codon:yes stop_codon:yes gene_type:complete
MPVKKEIFNYMISDNKIKQIQSLKTKKGRKKEGLFLIEGVRCISSFLEHSNNLRELFVIRSITSINKNIINLCKRGKIPYSIISNKIMKVISDTKTPSGILGISKFYPPPELNLQSKRWLYLHKISDPGNLGTILRSAAWFNIKNIALSKDSTDPYSPKTIRSATGAHLHLNIYQEVDYKTYLEHDYLLLGADQNGDNKLEDSDYYKKIVVFLGNESGGLNASIKKRMDKLISVKRLGFGESLNVAIAGSIIMNKLAIK